MVTAGHPMTAAGADVRRGTLDDLDVLVRAVVRGHVQGRRVQALVRRRVEHHHVGVEPGLEPALAVAQPEKSSGRAGHRLHPGLGGEPALPNPLESEGEPSLDARQPAGDLGEVTRPLGSTPHAPAPSPFGEGAMVGGHHLDAPVRQPLPQCLAIVVGAQRRHAHVVERVVTLRCEQL